MPRTARFCLPVILSLLFCCTALDAEDVKLREQAVNLMERADAASLIAGFRDYEQVVTFTFHDLLNGTNKVGTFSRISAGSDGRRDEFTYADYHAITAVAGSRLSTAGGAHEPPEIV